MPARDQLQMHVCRKLLVRPMLEKGRAVVAAAVIVCFVFSA
jgi:hypothetical protein